MNKKTKAFFNNPWVIGIGVTIVSYLITSLLNKLVTGVDFKTSLRSVLVFLWKVLNFGIPLWLIIIILLLVRLIFKFLKASVEEQNPEWWYYTKDEFNIRLPSDEGDIIPIPFQSPQYDEVRTKRIEVEDSLLFRWRYYRSDSGKYDLADILPICKNCECALIRAENWFLTCPHCERKYLLPGRFNPEEVRRKVDTLIRHKISSGEYKSSPYFEK